MSKASHTKDFNSLHTLWHSDLGWGHEIADQISDSNTGMINDPVSKRIAEETSSRRQNPTNELLKSSQSPTKMDMDSKPRPMQFSTEVG